MTLAYEWVEWFNLNLNKSIVDYTEMIGLEMNQNEINWFRIDFETEKYYIDQKFLLICFERKTCWVQGLKLSGFKQWGKITVTVRLRSEFADPWLRITLIVNQLITMRIVILSVDLYKKLSSMLLKVNLDSVQVL